MSGPRPARRRAFFQIHLVSCLAMMFAAGGMLAVNMAGDWGLVISDFRQGWQDNPSGERRHGVYCARRGGRSVGFPYVFLYCEGSEPNRMHWIPVDGEFDRGEVWTRLCRVPFRPSTVSWELSSYGNLLVDLGLFLLACGVTGIFFEAIVVGRLRKHIHLWVR